MELVAVAAVSDNLAIGLNGAIPWDSLPADRRQYRARVAKEPVILGRRTFESMVGDLPGRAQIVVSRSTRTYDMETAYPVTGVEEAIDQAKALQAETAYVLGGAEIYHLFLSHLDRMILSHIPGEYQADAFFPEWDRDEWTLIETIPKDGFTIEKWVRESINTDA